MNEDINRIFREFRTKASELNKSEGGIEQLNALEKKMYGDIKQVFNEYGKRVSKDLREAHTTLKNETIPKLKLTALREMNNRRETPKSKKK